MKLFISASTNAIVVLLVETLIERGTVPSESESFTFNRSLILHSDRGTEFTSVKWNELSSLLTEFFENGGHEPCGNGTWRNQNET